MILIIVERHFVSTTYLMDRTFPRTLLHFHKKLQSWLPPGGHIEANESPYEAALREIEEETFLTPENSSLKFIFKNKSILSELDHRSKLLEMPYFLLEEEIEKGTHFHLDWIYYAHIEDKDLEIIKNNTEHNNFRWFDYNELLNEEQCFDNVKELAFHGFELFYG